MPQSEPERSENGELLAQLDRSEEQTGRKVETVTADAGYRRPKNYEALEKRGVEAVVVPQRWPEIPGCGLFSTD